MKFNSLQDAEKELSKYSNLTGVIYPVLNKKIWSLFVGISDETMSLNIYLGIRGDFPIHTFTKFDLDNIEFWAGFYDDTIAPLNDILQEDYLKSLCEPLALYKEVEILENWSDPIQVPKGLGFKMTFSDDKKICYKIFDSKNPQNYNEHTIERNENHYKIYRYNSDYGLTEMEQPSITFKLPDNNYNPSGISLLFINE